MVRFQILAVLLPTCRSFRPFQQMQTLGNMPSTKFGSSSSIASCSDQWIPEILSKLTVVTLKQKCREAGLPVSGRKVELIERLHSFAASNGEDKEGGELKSGTSETIVRGPTGGVSKRIVDVGAAETSQLNGEDGESNFFGSVSVSTQRSLTDASTWEADTEINPEDSQQNSNALLLLGLPRNVTKGEILDLFSSVSSGEITDVEVFNPPHFRSKGRAFVIFGDAHGAQDSLSRGERDASSFDVELPLRGSVVYAKPVCSSRVDKELRQTRENAPLAKNARVLLKEACDRKRMNGQIEDSKIAFTPTATILRNVRTGRRLVKTHVNGFAPDAAAPSPGFVSSAFRVECAAAGLTASAEADSIKAARESSAARVLTMLVDAQAVDIETREDFDFNNIRQTVETANAYEKRVAKFVRERGEDVVVCESKNDSARAARTQMESDANRDIGFLPTFEEVDAALRTRVSQTRAVLDALRTKSASKDPNSSGSPAEKPLDCDNDGDWSHLTSLDELTDRVSIQFTLAFTLLKRRFASSVNVPEVSLRWIDTLRSLDLPTPLPTSETIGSCLSTLSFLGEYQVMERILETVGPPLDPSFMNHLTTAYLAARKPDLAAHHVLKGGMTEKFGVRPHAGHVQVLLMNKRMRDSVEEAIETDLPRLGLAPTTQTMNSYMKATLSQKTDPDKVIRIFKSIQGSEKLELTTESWTRYIDALGQKGDVDGAFRVIDQEMPREAVTVVHLNMVVAALGKNDKPLDAYALFLDIPSKYGLHYDPHSFPVAMLAVARNGSHVDLAEAIFALLNSTQPLNGRVAPQAGAAAKSAAKSAAATPAAAEAPLPTLMTLRGKPPPGGRWPPDKLAVGALLQAHVRAGDLERADEILSWMKTKSALSKLTSEQRGGGGGGGGGDEERRCADLDAVTFNRLLSAWAVAGQWAKVSDLLAGALARREFALLPSTASEAAAAATATAPAATRASSSTSASAVLKRQQPVPGQGEVVGALRLFGEFEEVVGCDPTTDLQADVATFNSLLYAAGLASSSSSSSGTRGMVERVSWREGARLLKLMLARGLQPTVVTLNSFMDLCAKDGASEGAHLTAVRVFSDMRKGLYKGIKPDRLSYNVAIAACREAGQWKTAKTILGSMKRDGLDPDLITFNSLLAVGVKSSGVEREAMQLFEAMANQPDAGCQPDTNSLDCLLDILASSSDFEEEAARYYARGHLSGFFQHYHSDRFLVDLHGCSQIRAGFTLRVVLGYLRVTTTLSAESPTSSSRVAVKHTLIRDDFTVVTGKGLHSTSEFVLGPAARNFLANPNNFYPPLELEDVPGNAGRFVIKKRSLLNWVISSKLATSS